MKNETAERAPSWMARLARELGAAEGPSLEPVEFSQVGETEWVLLVPLPWLGPLRVRAEGEGVQALDGGHRLLCEAPGVLEPCGEGRWQPADRIALEVIVDMVRTAVTKVVVGEPAAAARSFADELLSLLSEEELALVDAENKALPDEVCASHDRCDANVAMASAFADVIGEDVEVERPGHVAFWNEAWRLARQVGYANLAKRGRR